MTRTSVRRALRITATLAGIAVIGATFTGTAAAAVGADGADGTDSSPSDSFSPAQDGESAETPEVAKDNLDGETMSPRFHQPGLVTFDAPTLDTN